MILVFVTTGTPRDPHVLPPAYPPRRSSDLGAPPAPWHVVRPGKLKPTSYRVADVAGKLALEASVDSSMALMARPITIDLAKSPMLCWRWLIEAPVAKADKIGRASCRESVCQYV